MFKFLLITFIFSSNFLDFTFLRIVKADLQNSLLLEGIEKIKRDDFEGALNDINKFLKQDPTNWEAYHHRGNSKYNLNDFKGAISDYSKAIELNPNPWEISFYRRGYSFQKLGNYKNAISDYNLALKVNPKYEDAYFDRGFLKAELNDFNGAIDDYSKYLELVPEDYVAYRNRGIAKQKLKDFKGAISDFNSAIKINPEYELAYFSKAYIKYLIEDNKAAIEGFSQLIKLNPKSEDAYFYRALSKNKLEDMEGAIKDMTSLLSINNNDLEAYNRRAYFYGKLEKYISAIKDLDKAINIKPNAFSLNNRAFYKTKINDLKGALIDHSKAIEIDPYNAHSFNARAFIKYDLGDLDGALSDYKRVFEIGNNEEILKTINYLTGTYFYHGIYQDILPLINKGKSISQNIQDKNDDYLDLFYKEAIYYGSIGEINKAKASLKKCLFESEKINLINSFKTIECKKYLADIHIYDFKDFKEAKNLFKFRSLEGQLIRSKIAFKEKNYSKAQKILKRLYDRQFKENKLAKPNHNLSEMLGYAYWWDGKNKKAKIYHEEALKGYEEMFGQESHYLIQPLLNVGMVYFNEKNYEKADFFIRKSLEIQFKYIQDQIPFLPISKRNKFLQTLGISYQAIFTASEIHPRGNELALFARLNRHGLLEEIEKKQITLASLKGSKKVLMQKIKDLTNQLSSTNEIDIKSLETMKLEKEELERELYKSLPQLKSQIYTLSDISKEIPKDAVLIEFQKYRPFVFDDPDQSMDEETWEDPKYQALILFPNNKVESIDLGKASEIDQLISKGLISSEQSLIDAQDLWYELGLKIIKPLEKYIKNKKTLFISPDSELNKVPFAAIGSFKNENLLGDVFKIRLITTGRDLITLNKEKNLTNKQSIVVANPDFNLLEKSVKNSSELISSEILKGQKRSFDQKKRLWSSLPGTKKEAGYISKIIDAKLFVEEEASALNIQKQDSPKILHIATHSFYIGDKKEENIFAELFFSSNSLSYSKKFENPLLRSGIVLAGANYPEKNLNDDGYLTALEVSKLNWNGTELVVVSGCESGQGDLQSGEGVYGLKRAITVAGARSSLLSLWEVDDKATAAFMESFYLKLKSGESRSNALSKTQKEFRNHNTGAWQHPNVWAAFQLNGDWRPINF